MVDAIRYVLQSYSAERDIFERVLEARQFWVFWGFLLVYPISFYRSLDSLKFTSTLSLILIYALAFGIVLYGHGVFSPCDGISISYNMTTNTYGDVLPPKTWDTTGYSKGNINSQQFIPSGSTFPKVNTHQFATVDDNGSRNSFVEDYLMDFSLDSEDSAEHYRSKDQVLEGSNEEEDNAGHRSFRRLFGRSLEEESEEDALDSFAEDLAETIFGDMDDQPPCRGEVEPWTSPAQTIQNLAIFVFSFTCHQNIFAVVNELKNRTQFRMDMVIVASIGSALLLYLVVALEGYRTYGNFVLGDILLNYPQTGLVTFMRMSIAVMAILSYPLQLDPGRRCFTSVARSLKKKFSRLEVAVRAQQGFQPVPTEDELAMEKKSPACVIIVLEEGQSTQLDEKCFKGDGDIPMKCNNDRESETRLFNGITCVFLAISLSISLAVSDLGTILSVVGATGSTMVSFVLPGSIYIKLHRKFTLTKALAYVQLAVGLVIIPTALYYIFR